MTDAETCPNLAIAYEELMGKHGDFPLDDDSYQSFVMDTLEGEPSGG